MGFPIRPTDLIKSRNRENSIQTDKIGSKNFHETLQVPKYIALCRNTFSPQI